MTFTTKGSHQILSLTRSVEGHICIYMCGGANTVHRQISSILQFTLLFFSKQQQEKLYGWEMIWIKMLCIKLNLLWYWCHDVYRSKQWESTFQCPWYSSGPDVIGETMEVLVPYHNMRKKMWWALCTTRTLPSCETNSSRTLCNNLGGKTKLSFTFVMTDVKFSVC